MSIGPTLTMTCMKRVFDIAIAYYIVSLSTWINNNYWVPLAVDSVARHEYRYYRKIFTQYIRYSYIRT